MSLVGLPVDVFREVVSQLEVIDVVSLVSSCRLFYDRYDDGAWKDVFVKAFQYYSRFVEDSAGSWRERTIAAWEKRNKVAVVYAFTPLFPPHTAELMKRSAMVLRSAGLVVYPVAIIQSQFNEEVLKEVESTLQKVSTVLFFSNGYFAENQIWHNFGNILSRFILSGKNVVVGVFGNCTKTEAPGGDWLHLNFNPIQIHGQVTGSQYYKPSISYSSSSSEEESMEAPTDSNPNQQQHNQPNQNELHPILRGVHSFRTSRYVASGQVHPEAEVISQYQSGMPMAAWLKVQKCENGMLNSGGILSINIVPAPGDIRAEGGWRDKKDPSIFLINSICWALNNQWASKLIGRRDFDIPTNFEDPINN
eukprot:TRINITY_DN1449_c0_g1_i1.p1 TRINITY_DN1449_c0_g1~~TRINITY_DN1449_c0_g1_i1.p1  ORF type:complete len:363 (-),score=55.70 TRINITY_DN1449_c0_g1_i1:485-1573(-)